MRYLLELIFGKRAIVKESLHKPNFRTTHPENPLTFDEWVKELNVSVLYGKKAVYMNNF